MGAWDDPSAFGLVTPQQVQAAPVVAQPSTPAADPWSNPAAFGLTPAQPAQSASGQTVPDAQTVPAVPQPDGFFARADNVARTAFNQATFGAGKYIDAAETALEQPLFHGGSNAPSFGQRYADDLTAEKARLASVPTAVQVATSIPAGLAGVSGVGALGKAALAGARYIPGVGAALDAAGSAIEPASNLLARIPGAASVAPVAKSAAVGAGYGAVAGAGDADNGNRLAGALHGAETGAVLGPIMEGTVNALGAGYGAVKNALGGLGLGQATPVADAAGNALSQPVTAAQALAAGQKIQSATSDPIAVRNALAQPTEIVPGSPVTTYQATGDQGLGSLERGVSQKDPGSFIDLRNQQNAARVSALAKSVPADASAANIGPAFSKQLADLDAQHQSAVDAAKASVGTSLDAAGGTAVSGDAASAQQQYGAQLRGQLDAANQSAKAKEGALWDAVDPQGNLGVDASPIQAAAQQVLREHGQFATPLGGDEAHTLNTAADAPDQMKFSDVKDLRDQITTALPKARMAGDMQTVRRLSILLDGVHGALDGAVSSQAASDAAAVQAGTMAPDQTIMARLGQKVGPDQSSVPVPGPNGSGGSAMAPGPSGQGGPAYEIGQGGSGVPAGAGSGSGPGDSGLAVAAPTQVAMAPFDADAAARYAAARQATADRHATFTNAPGVGPVLQQGRWAGDFKAPDSAVPGQLFGAGRGAAEKVQSYLKAGGDPSQLAGYAAFDMRRVAANPDGTINAARLAAWQARYSEALSALPDLNQKLSTVAGAQDALDSATGAQTAAKQAYQSSAAGKFLGDVDPVKTVASILNGNKAQSQMAQLASASADPDTRAGLQKAVIDHVFSQMQGDKLAGQTGTTQLYGAQLQKFVRQKLPALREIMTPDQVDMAQKVAADIQRSDQSLSGNVLPAGSATAQNAAAANKASAGGTLLQHIRQHAAETLIGAGVGTPLGGAIGSMFGTSGAIIGSSVGGTAGGIAGKVVSGLKAANIATVDDLVKQAMLNPGLAKVLLAKVDAANAPNVGNALASQLGRVAAAGGGALAGRSSN